MTHTINIESYKNVDDFFNKLIKDKLIDALSQRERNISIVFQRDLDYEPECEIINNDVSIDHGQSCNGGYWFLIVDNIFLDAFEEGESVWFLGGERNNIDFILEIIESKLFISGEYHDLEIEIDRGSSRFLSDVLQGKKLDWHAFIDPDYVATDDAPSSPPLSYNRLAHSFDNQIECLIQ